MRSGSRREGRDDSIASKRSRFRVSRKNFLYKFRGVQSLDWKSAWHHVGGGDIGTISMKSPAGVDASIRGKRHGLRGRTGEFKRDWPNGSSPIRHFTQP